MARNPSDEALNRAAAAVRAELIRLDYLESDDVTPDGEDKAIAAAAIKTYLEALAKTILEPPEYSDFS